MKLSVILPCYNGASTVAVQLDALCQQQWHGGWEVVVVNNGSTDDSMKIVQDYQGRLPDLQIAQAHRAGAPRLGVPHSYNTGMQAASGDAFVFCEADDEVAPGWLDAMGRALEQHEFVAARLDHRKLNPPWLHPTQGDGYQSECLSRMQGYPDIAHASGCSFGLRRSLVDRLGPLDVRFPCSHDTEYSWRAHRAGVQIHLVRDAIVCYREKQDTRARFRQARNWALDAARLREHYGTPARADARIRRLIPIVRTLPAGLIVGTARLTARLLGNDRARHDWAEWVFNLGWSWGEWRAAFDTRSKASATPTMPPDIGQAGAH